MRAFFVFIFTLTALIARNLPQETENLSPKIVAVDWTAAEILRSIGYDVAAIGDKRNYEIWVKEPSVENAVDLGLRMQPNLEALIKLKPDFIIIPSFFEFNKNALAQYARVEVVDAYKEGDLYENILDATHRIAKIAKREKEKKKHKISYEKTRRARAFFKRTYRDDPVYRQQAFENLRRKQHIRSKPEKNGAKKRRA